MTTEPPPPPSGPTPPAPPPPELAKALDRFDAGDFRGMDAEVARLLAEPPSPEVAAAGRALLARLDPDPAALAVGVAAIVALAAASAAYL